MFPQLLAFGLCYYVHVIRDSCNASRRARGGVSCVALGSCGVVHLHPRLGVLQPVLQDARAFFVIYLVVLNGLSADVWHALVGCVHRCTCAWCVN